MDRIVDYQGNDWKELYSDGSCLDPGTRIWQWPVGVCTQGVMGHFVDRLQEYKQPRQEKWEQPSKQPRWLQQEQYFTLTASMSQELSTGEGTTWDGGKAPMPANGKPSG